MEEVGIWAVEFDEGASVGIEVGGLVMGTEGVGAALDGLTVVGCEVGVSVDGFAEGTAVGTDVGLDEITTFPLFISLKDPPTNVLFLASSQVFSAH